MKDRDLLKLLCKNGWHIQRIQGSHHVLKKSDQTIVLPIHGTDIKPGLLNAILKKSGLKGAD